MSDPVSNAEIEDVLSSIRRLVSTESKEEPRSQDTIEQDMVPVDTQRKPQTETEAAVPKEDARLVLTPSFRISPEPETTELGQASEAYDSLTLEQWQVAPPSDGDEDIGEAIELGGEEHDDAPRDTGQTDDVAMDDQHAQDWLEADTSEKEDDAAWAAFDEDDAEETDPDDAPVAFVPFAFAEDVQSALNAEDDALGFVKAHGTDEVASALPDAALEPEKVPSELEARIAEVEAAVAARQDQWEPDVDDQDEYAGGTTEPLPWEDHIDVDAEPSLEAESARPEKPTEPEVTFAAPPVDPAEAEMDDGVADAPELKPDTDTVLGSPKTGDTEPAGWYNEDAILDEDALRDLVSEIVRQELQGTLGERITRNVRKLVRREIHRAMLGQDFD